MALEALNSVMSLQAQKSQPVTTKPQAVAEYTDVSLTDKAPKVDNTTLVVENASEKSESYTDREPSREQLHVAVEELNRKMVNSEAVYGFHEATNRVTIKIVDKDTKEVIKELPPERTLDLIAKAWELAGLLVDERR